MSETMGVSSAPKARAAIGAAQRLLQELGKQELAAKLSAVEADLRRERFTLAVVGEFSRGKSTLINRLLNRELLPVGNMPTTAMLTCIRPAGREAMVYVDEKGKQSSPRPISPESWQGLTANNFGGPDPQGTVFMGVKDAWMAGLSLEILDTPGAGDLEDRRAKRIGDALLEADGAIITVSALSPMSMSEQQFIQQRLITRKTPFLMLAITKLDEVPQSQRERMIQFILQKLLLWKMDIPVFVAGNVPVPGGRYDGIIGYDKLRAQIARWVADPQRQALTQRWILARVDDILATAQEGLNEQLRLLGMEADKRQEAIAQKKQQLARIHEGWESLRQDMRSRGDQCAQAVMDRAQELQGDIIQRLTHEARRCGQPAVWWRQDFGYRLRVELANLASNLDGFASRQIQEDVRWLNGHLEKNFKTNVAARRETVADKHTFTGLVQEQELTLEDLDKQKNISRVATTALTIVGSLTLSSLGLGMLNILATSGIGTGSALLTEKFFKAKVEQQRQVVEKAVAIQVPRTLEEALADTRKRLELVYEDIVQAAAEREEAWTKAQTEAMAGAADAQEPQAQSILENRSQRLSALRQAIAQ